MPPPPEGQPHQQVEQQQQLEQQQQPASEVPDQQQQQLEQQQQQQPQQQQRRGWRGLLALGSGSARLATVVGGLLALSAAAAVAAVVRQQRRRHSRAKHARARHAAGRIPLRDLVRFKERQWFVEELENARDGDSNAMVRLAKMYLHGQGCHQNVALAQEWVRKARVLGLPASLDELFATDDPNPRQKLRALAAAEERRRSARKLQASAGLPPHRQPAQSQHAAAA